MGGMSLGTEEFSSKSSPTGPSTFVVEDHVFCVHDANAA